MVTNDTLNRKLAEWAGLEVHLTNTPTGKPEMWLKDGAVFTNIDWVDFTNSLDACFTWLVPKIKRDDINLGIDFAWDRYHNHVGVSVVYYGAWHKDYTATDKSSALALCLAIEKLIDGEQQEAR